MSSSMSYPYRADYNDHFETPLRAYQDVAPLLEAGATPADLALRVQLQEFVFGAPDLEPYLPRELHRVIFEWVVG